MTNRTGYIIAIVLLSLGFLYLWFTRNDGNKRILNDVINKASDSVSNVTESIIPTRSSDQENTCTITDAYGRSLQIKGDINDPQFQALCRLPYQQQVWFNYYPYRFIGRGRHWSRGGHGVGGPGGPGSGTGGGTGPGTGGGGGPH